jgi:hypothetical protein
MEMIPAARHVLEQVADLKIDPETDARLQELMDRNNFGELNGTELGELKRIVAANQQLSILRAQAMLVLGRKPA